MSVKQKLYSNGNLTTEGEINDSLSESKIQFLENGNINCTDFIEDDGTLLTGNIKFRLKNDGSLIIRGEITED